MRLTTLLFLVLACTCVRAQINTLPTIDDPQDADRLYSFTRGFPAEWRLDTLRGYFAMEIDTIVQRAYDPTTETPPFLDKFKIIKASDGNFYYIDAAQRAIPFGGVGATGAPGADGAASTVPGPPGADGATGPQGDPATDDQTLSVEDGGLKISGSNSVANPFTTSSSGTSVGESWNTFNYPGVFEKYFRNTASNAPPISAHYVGLNLSAGQGSISQIAMPMVVGQGGKPHFRIYNPTNSTWAAWEPFDSGTDDLGGHLMSQNLKTNGYWISRSGAANGIFFNAAGKLGVNTSTPVGDFHVNQLKSSFGDAASSLNSTRALNLVSSNAVMRVMRVSPNVETAAPAIELMHRTSADGANTAYWDIYAVTNSLNFRNRVNNRIPFKISSAAPTNTLTLNASSMVGIGTDSPVDRLEVNGGVTATSFTGDGSGLTNLPSDNLGNHTLTEDLITSTHAIRQTSGTGAGLEMRADGIDINGASITRLTDDELTWFTGGTWGFRVGSFGIQQRLGNSFYRQMPNLIPSEEGLAWTNNPNGTGQYTRMDRHDGLTSTTSYNLFPAGGWLREPDLDVVAKSGTRYGFRLVVYYDTNSGTNAEIRFSASSGTISGFYLEGDDGLPNIFVNNTTISLPASSSLRRRTFEGTFTINTTTTIECEIRGVSDSFSMETGTEISTWTID